MHYYQHAELSAKKFNCNIEDTLKLHKIMDSSKNYHVHFTHRLFSHNTWFIQIVTDLIGDTIPNTKMGGYLSTRDILFEHLREDLNGECPTIKDWLNSFESLNIKLEATRWFNRPRKSDLELLNVK